MLNDAIGWAMVQGVQRPPNSRRLEDKREYHRYLGSWFYVANIFPLGRLAGESTKIA